MKRLSLLIPLAAMLASGAAFAGEAKAPESTKLPVLVQVNDQGQITRAEPAYKLTPKLESLLRTNLAEMIRKPAAGPNGKPVASQFVMEVALHNTPLADGTVAAEFVYVATEPLAPGRWQWAHNVDGHSLALVNATNRSWASQPPYSLARPTTIDVIDPPQPIPMFAITPTTAR